MNYLGSNPVKIIGRTTTNNLINQNLLIGKTGISKATFEGYDCIKMTGYAITTIPFHSKAGLPIRLSADFAYENGIDMYWVFKYADGTKSTSLYSISISSGNSSFKRMDAIIRDIKKDIVGIEISRYGGSSRSVYIKDVMLNYGETALPYEPYNDRWRVRSGALIRNPKNLVKFNEGTYTSAGLTTTTNGGVVSIKGTLTAESYERKTVPTRLEVGKRYTYCLNTTSYGSNVRGNVQVETSKGVWVKNVGSDSGKGFTFTVTEDMYANGNRVRVNIYAYGKGKTYDFTCYPTLNEGNTAEPFYIQD